MAASGNLPALPPASGPPNKSIPSSSGLAPSRLVIVASGLHLGRALHLNAARRLQLFLLRSPASTTGLAIYHLDHLTKLNAFIKHFLLEIYSVLEALVTSFSWNWPSLHFSSGKEPERGHGDGELSFGAAEGSPSEKGNGHLWTNALIAVNILLYGAQILTHGKALLLGAKVNDLIKQGQIWRLVTSSFLHANLMHLMVNCYSLNSVGPPVEKSSGPGRFVAIYFTSAIASSILSYRFCTSPSVGASGAIFGLVGSRAIFVLRHRRFIGGGKEEMQQIANVIAINMVIGFLARNTDNWGHLGGLLGGAAVSWFLGPAWSYECEAKDGRVVLADRAPFSRLLNKQRGR